MASLGNTLGNTSATEMDYDEATYHIKHKEGICNECSETFLDISCYKEGGVVYCPLCMNELQFNFNLGEGKCDPIVIAQTKTKFKDSIGESLTNSNGEGIAKQTKEQHEQTRLNVKTKSVTDINVHIKEHNYTESNARINRPTSAVQQVTEKDKLSKEKCNQAEMGVKEGSKSTMPGNAKSGDEGMNNQNKQEVDKVGLNVKADILTESVPVKLTENKVQNKENSHQNEVMMKTEIKSTRPITTGNDNNRIHKKEESNKTGLKTKAEIKLTENGNRNTQSKPLQFQLRQNEFQREKTEFIANNRFRKSSPAQKRMERSKTMFAGDADAVASKQDDRKREGYRSTPGPKLLNISSEIPLQLEKEFQCKRHSGCVNSILPIGSEIAWVVIKNSFLVLYDKNGNLLHSANRLKKTFTDAASDKNANIYLACYNDGCIMKISRVGIMSVFTNLNQMHPTELAISNDDEIIVAVVGTKDATFNPKKNYGILIFDSEGNRIKSVFDLTVPFLYPVYVDVSATGQIAVGDYLRKEVVVTDAKCQNEIFRFTGTDVFARSFIPKGVCFDCKGNLIVANWDGAMCLLRQDEGFSAVGLTISDEFEPLSIAVDGYNRIWAGSRFNGKIRIYNFDQNIPAENT